MPSGAGGDPIARQSTPDQATWRWSGRAMRWRCARAHAGALTLRRLLASVYRIFTARAGVEIELDQALKRLDSAMPAA